MNNRQIVTQCRAILKERTQIDKGIIALEVKEEALTDKLSELASLHCGINMGDEVTTGIFRGIVTRISFRYDKAEAGIAIVRATPLMKGKRQLHKYGATRTFTKPSLLTVIASGDKVAPYKS